MTNQILMKDKFSLSNLGYGLRGEIIFGIGKHQVPFIDPFGNKSFRTVFDKILHKGHNIVTIGGYQFAFDKLFNIAPDQESTLRVGDLNDESPQMKIGVPRMYYESMYYTEEKSTKPGETKTKGGINISGNNFIFGFMIGNGGSKEDPSIAIAPDYKNRGLYNAIPFRMSNDTYDEIDPYKYFGKQVSSNMVDGTDVVSYYVKKFDDPQPHIVHCWASDKNDEMDIVDDSVFSSTSSNAIESYVEMNISLSEYDSRGFFGSVDENPKINEFGLVSGWYNDEEGDYECLRMITHYTRSSIILAEGDTVEAVYRLYAR